MKLTITAIILMGLLSWLYQPASAELPISSELKGIEQVLGIIGNASLVNPDPKTRQSIQDVLEAKSQLYQGAKSAGRSPLATQKSPVNRPARAY